jgi:WD40 repeat protein
VWDIDSGRELPLPESVRPASLLSFFSAHAGTVADAAGVRWLERTTVPQVLGFGLPFQLRLGGSPFMGIAPGAPLDGPGYIAYRWDRASGRTVAHRFRPGDGSTNFSVQDTSADGRITVFHTIPLNTPGRGGSRGLPGQRRGATDTSTECWDLVADPPRRLWAVSGPSASSAVSPGGKMVVLNDGNTVTVYRAEGKAGEPQPVWSAPFPPNAFTYSVGTVSDDGRLAFALPNTMLVYRRDTLPPVGPVGEMEVTRQKMLYHRDTSHIVLQFAPDGRTLMTADYPSYSSTTVRLWDTDPEPAVGRGHFTPTQTSPDGRLTIEYPPPRPGPGVLRTGDYVLRDARSGAEIGRIPTNGGLMTSVTFVAGSQRVLVGYYSFPEGNRPSDPPRKRQWALFDTDGLRQVAGGEMSALVGRSFTVVRPSPGGRWLVETGDECIVRDPLTGRPTCRVRPPDGGMVAAVAFDPSEDQVAVVTTPRPPAPTGVAPRMPGGRTPAGPLNVRVCDAASGVTLWDRPGLDECTTETTSPMFTEPVQVVWTPDRRRLLVRYQAAAEGRVWVGRAADGATERTLAGPADARRNSGPVGGVNEWVVLDPAGQRVAVTGGAEVRVWDLESGKLLATAGDFEGTAASAAFTADGSRLIALDAPRAGPLSGRVSRVVVWDAATDRLLAAFQSRSSVITPVNRNERVGGSEDFQFRDGKLILTGLQERQVFDGNPVAE